MSSESFSLPKPEFIQGEIDYPEMIKRDFKKAISILGSSVLLALITVAGLFALFYFI